MTRQPDACFRHSYLRRNTLLDLISTPNTELFDALRIDKRQSLSFRRKENIAVIGEPIEQAYVIRSGWACCHWRLVDGRRQILQFFLKGDMIGIVPLLANVSEHRQNAERQPIRTSYTVTALTPVEAVPIESALAKTALKCFPDVCDALSSRIADSTNELLARRLTTLGQCNARERMAVLFLELWLRQIELGVADETGFPLPVNQTSVGDALGLTAVHVSRTLGKFEDDGILSATQDGPKRIRVYDGMRLRRIASTVTGPNGVGRHAQ